MWNWFFPRILISQWSLIFDLFLGNNLLQINAVDENIFRSIETDNIINVYTKWNRWHKVRTKCIIYEYNIASTYKLLKRVLRFSSFFRQICEIISDGKKTRVRHNSSPVSRVQGENARAREKCVTALTATNWSLSPPRSISFTLIFYFIFSFSRLLVHIILLLGKPATNE